MMKWIGLGTGLGIGLGVGLGIVTTYKLLINCSF